MNEAERPAYSAASTAAEKTFRGWRLLGYLGIVVVTLAIVAAVVDRMVLGPLLGRVL